MGDVFAGMIEVEDFNRSGKSQAAVFPNPCSSVSYEDDLLGPIKTTPTGFLMEQYGDLAAAFVGCKGQGRFGIGSMSSEGVFDIDASQIIGELLEALGIFDVPAQLVGFPGRNAATGVAPVFP